MSGKFPPQPFVTAKQANRMATVGKMVPIEKNDGKYVAISDEAFGISSDGACSGNI